MHTITLAKESRYITYQATFDTFNHHDLRFPNPFLCMILEINHKQHFLSAAA